MTTELTLEAARDAYEAAVKTYKATAKAQAAAYDA